MKRWRCNDFLPSIFLGLGCVSLGRGCESLLCGVFSRVCVCVRECWWGVIFSQNSGGGAGSGAARCLDEVRLGRAPESLHYVKEHDIKCQ